MLEDVGGATLQQVCALKIRVKSSRFFPVVTILRDGVEVEALDLTELLICLYHVKPP